MFIRFLIIVAILGLLTNRSINQHVKVSYVSHPLPIDVFENDFTTVEEGLAYASAIFPLSTSVRYIGEGTANYLRPPSPMDVYLYEVDTPAYDPDNLTAPNFTRTVKCAYTKEKQYLNGGGSFLIHQGDGWSVALGGGIYNRDDGFVRYITLDDCWSLQQKGDSLTMDDFRAFVGAYTKGVKLYPFHNNDKYKLYVGFDETGKITYTKLCGFIDGEKIDEGIDIRYESVSDYTSKLYNFPN